jgi:hypothetical protein
MMGIRGKIYLEGQQAFGSSGPCANLIPITDGLKLLAFTFLCLRSGSGDELRP